MTNNARARLIPHLRIFTAAAAAMLTLALVGCGSSSSSPAASSGKSGQVTHITMEEDLFTMANASLYVAIKKGYFAANGLDVNLETLTSGSTVADLVQSGKVNIAASATFEMAPLEAEGAQFLAFYNRGNVTVEFCAANSFMAQHKITKSSSLAAIASSFRGATIGISGVNSTPDLVGRYFFEKYGHLNPNTDLKVVALGSQPAVVTALERGDVDGFFASPPTCSSAVASGKATLLLLPDQVPAFSQTPQNIIYTTKSYAKSHANVLRAISTAMQEASNYSRTHPAQVVTILQSYLPTISKSILTSELKLVIIPSIPANPRMTQSGWQSVSEIVKPITGTALNTALGGMWTNQYLSSN